MRQRYRDMEGKYRFRRLKIRLIAALWGMAFALLLSSCAAPKNTAREARADYSGVLGQMQARLDSLAYDMRLVRRMESVKSSSIDLENETTFFSLPDSTGRQYPTAVSKTTVGREENEGRVAETEAAVSMRKILEEVSALRGQLDAALSGKEETESLSRWDLHKDKVYAGAILLLAVCVLYLKSKKGG